MRNKKRHLLLIVLQLFCLHVMCQMQLNVYSSGCSEAYEMRNVGEIVFSADSFRIGSIPGYACHEVDSITLNRPVPNERKRGWWGDLQDEMMKYYAQYKIEDHVFEVCFSVTLADGICQAVYCEVVSEDGMMYFMQGETDTTGNPYIFVKSTQTKPRLYEEWVMQRNGLIPSSASLAIQAQELIADCTSILSGRMAEDVRTIIEAWVHQPAVLIQIKN